MLCRKASGRANAERAAADQPTPLKVLGPASVSVPAPSFVMPCVRFISAMPWLSVMSPPPPAVVMLRSTGYKNWRDPSWQNQRQAEV